MEKLNLVNVSVIITTHNRHDLLKKAVQSALSQTYNCKEIIIVDDNSNDGTGEYLYALSKEEPSVCWIHIDVGESKGGNYARNRGILAAHGDFIAFLDDDDEWLPQKIEKQIEIFQNDPDVGLVYCGGYREFDFAKKEKMPINREFIGDLSNLCFKSIFCTTSSIMVKKELLYAVKLFDINLKFWQEYDLCIRLAEITKIAAAEKPLFILRDITSDSVRLTNKLDGWIDAVKYIDTKYQIRINNLPEDIRLNRQIMICNEGIIRCQKVGNHTKEQEFQKQKKKFLFQLWKLKKTPKYLAKYILNH